tara:strand:+ start:145 stop:339 length:195 start_codon:yes stop_codon:yes gene_type:complete
MMDLQHGLIMFFFGMSMTFIGLFITFLIINYNQKVERKKKIKETGPLADLQKIMPGVKYGDDCQ